MGVSDLINELDVLTFATCAGLNQNNFNLSLQILIRIYVAKDISVLSMGQKHIA